MSDVLRFYATRLAESIQAMNDERRVSLADWLDRWEQDYADGQTTISREEAIRRWEQERQSDES